MLSSEWQTLSQSQPMQTSFIQFLAKRKYEWCQVNDKLYNYHSQCKQVSSNFITITANAKRFHLISCQKEIRMLSSEWQTLSQSQPMQKSFIQFLAKRKYECCQVNDKLYHYHSQCKQVSSNFLPKGNKNVV